MKCMRVSELDSVYVRIMHVRFKTFVYFNDIFIKYYHYKNGVHTLNVDTIHLSQLLLRVEIRVDTCEYVQCEIENYVV